MILYLITRDGITLFTSKASECDGLKTDFRIKREYSEAEYLESCSE